MDLWLCQNRAFPASIIVSDRDMSNDEWRCQRAAQFEFVGRLAYYAWQVWRRLPKLPAVP